MTTHYEADNNASFHLMAGALTRIAEALECRDTATDTPSSTKDSELDRLMTATGTSFVPSSTKPAKRIANIADYVSSRNPLPTKTDTSPAKTAPRLGRLDPKYLDHYWVEMKSPGESWLATHGPVYLANLPDAWTLFDALEEARKWELKKHE